MEMISHQSQLPIYNYSLGFSSIESNRSNRVLWQRYTYTGLRGETAESSQEKTAYCERPGRAEMNLLGSIMSDRKARPAEAGWHSSGFSIG